MSGYSEIPAKVYLLFAEIMHGGKPVELLSPEERLYAKSFCWFHDPPLLKGGSSLTNFGLAAFSWKQLQPGDDEQREPKKSNPYAKKNVNARMLEELSKNQEAY
jgi:hypothetical protein